MNSCNFIGRIGRDAVTRFTNGGKPVTGWALAVDTGFGEKKSTTWLDCSWWGERSVKVAEFIKKGDRLGVTGEIGTREHDGKTYVTLNVSDVTLLGEKKDGAQKAERPQQQRQAPQRGGGGAPPMDDFEDTDIPFITGYGTF